MLTPSELQAAAIPYGCLYNARSAALYLLGRIAGVTDPETIALNSAGFNLPISNETAMLFLLAQMAGVTNLDEIISGSAGYSGLNERAAAMYLAEVIASNGTNPPCSPMFETVPDGNESNIGLAMLDSGAVTSITYNLDTNRASIQLNSFGQADDNLQSFSAPLLASIDPLYLYGSGLVVGGGFFNELDVPLLAFIGGSLVVQAPTITDISLPSLVTIKADVDMSECVGLVNFSAPLWLPTNGTQIILTNGALSAASVNHVLARCVAAAVTTCTINLSLGTSAAPSGQGITDKADLITAGNTVTTN